MEHFNFLGFAALRLKGAGALTTRDITSVNSLQLALFLGIFLYDLILVFASDKIYIKKKKIMQADIFSCCESLECHRSAIFTSWSSCFVGKEKVVD